MLSIVLVAVHLKIIHMMPKPHPSALSAAALTYTHCIIRFPVLLYYNTVWNFSHVVVHRILRNAIMGAYNAAAP